MTRSGRVVKADAFDVINAVILVFLTLLCIFPFYYVFIYTISVPGRAAQGLALLPKGFTLNNYREVLTLPGILQATMISVARTVLGTAATLVACAFLSYILTQKALPARKLIYRFLVITMYFNAGLIPTYLVYARMYGLQNRFLIYILPYTVNAFFVVLIRTFIEQLPESLEESAFMEGAGYGTVFMRIIFPLSQPILATIAVFSAVFQWNSWFDNLLYTQGNESLRTLQLILLNFLREAQSIAERLREQGFGSTDDATMMELTPTTVRMTITMVITLPILFVYPFLQRYFVKGIMIGAVKG